MSAEIHPPVLDRELAMARVGGDHELLKELAGLFVEEYPRLMNELRTALTAGDAPQVERTAHGLKGSVANFGAPQAVECAFEIEKLGRRGELRPVADLVSTLDLTLLALHGELDRL